MNRTILLLTALALASHALPVAVGAEHIDYRKYALGAGVFLPPGFGSPPVSTQCLEAPAPFEVCFPVVATDATVELWAHQDYLEPFPIAGTVYFEDSVGAPISNRTSFCGHSPVYAIPASAAFLRVIVGPLANDTSTPPPCHAGFAVEGFVKAHFR